MKPLKTAIRAIQLHCAVMLEVVRFVWGGKDIRVTRTLETGIGDNCIYLQLLTRSPRPKRMIVLLTIFRNILIALT